MSNALPTCPPAGMPVEVYSRAHREWVDATVGDGAKVAARVKRPDLAEEHRRGAYIWIDGGRGQCRGWWPRHEVRTVQARQRDWRPAEYQKGPAYVTKAPQWHVACEECDWSTECWQRPVAVRAAQNHAQVCEGDE